MTRAEHYRNRTPRCRYCTRYMTWDRWRLQASAHTAIASDSRDCDYWMGYCDRSACTTRGEA